MFDAKRNVGILWQYFFSFVPIFEEEREKELFSIFVRDFSFIKIAQLV